MSQQPSRRPTAVTSVEDPQLPAPRAVGFRDRHDAGRKLAVLLEPLRAEQPVVVGIPRGGVPVAAEVALALHAPLDVAVVCKIGAPQNPEYAVGALAEGGVNVLSDRVARALGLSDAGLEALLEGVAHELAERLRRYRDTRPAIEISGRTVILVDDGLATGRSARAAMLSLRKRGAARVILAIPVAAPAAAQALAQAADQVVCVDMPTDLWAVGQWYDDFKPPADEEIATLLADPGASAGSGGQGAAPHVHEITIPLGRDVRLGGELSMAQQPRGIVVFAHGSGSSRLSPRNREVARALNDGGYATLLFDLLTRGEESDRRNVFDIPLLASRLLAASACLRERPEVASLALAYFGASTGAAAALTAAAELGDQAAAVISRGGRPDLARKLGRVHAPTLLIVGGADPQVLALNRDARRQLGGPSELVAIPGATHLFEEPGAIEQVSRLAIEWLDRYVGGGGQAGG